MKVFVVERETTGWLQDIKMVIVASTAEHAECVARSNSRDFRLEDKLKITEVNLDKCQILAKINIGA